MNYNIASQFTREVFDLSLKNLAQGKTPCLDNTPNEVLQALPTTFQELLFQFSWQCYKHNQIPTTWRHNKSILLCKKEDPLFISNYIPIALANTIYKLYTSILTTLLTNYIEQLLILHYSQEELCP